MDQKEQRANQAIKMCKYLQVKLDQLNAKQDKTDEDKKEIDSLNFQIYQLKRVLRWNAEKKVRKRTRKF